MTLAALAAVLAAGAAAAPAARPTRSRPCQIVCGDRLPSWSPDGRTIAFLHYVRGATGPRATIEAVRMPGGPVHAVVGLGRMSPQVPDGASGPFGSIVWSPDSARIAVTNWYGRLFTVEASGGQPRLVTGSSPSWSPDGRRIAFDRPVDVGGYKRHQVVPTEGRGAAAAGASAHGVAGSGASSTGGSGAATPAWSSRGEIAYVTGPRMAGSALPDTTRAEIWSSPPDGGAATRLVPSGGGPYSLIGWSRD